MVWSRFRSIPMRRTGAFAPCLARRVVLNLQVGTHHILFGSLWGVYLLFSFGYFVLSIVDSNHHARSWVGVVLPSLSFIRMSFQNCPRFTYPVLARVRETRRSSTCPTWVLAFLVVKLSFQLPWIPLWKVDFAPRAVMRS